MEISCYCDVITASPYVVIITGTLIITLSDWGAKCVHLVGSKIQKKIQNNSHMEAKLDNPRYDSIVTVVFRVLKVKKIHTFVYHMIADMQNEKFLYRMINQHNATTNKVAFVQPPLVFEYLFTNRHDDLSVKQHHSYMILHHFDKIHCLVATIRKQT